MHATTPAWPLDERVEDARRRPPTSSVPLRGADAPRSSTDQRTRILMKNIAYVGALVALLDLDMEVVKGMLEEKFAAKRHLHRRQPQVAIQLGHDYAKEHFDCPLPIRAKSLHARPDGHIMIDGNTAAALGCSVRRRHRRPRGTRSRPRPRSSTASRSFCKRFRHDARTATNERTIIIQAEDELSAAGHDDRRGVGRLPARSRATSGAGISPDERVHRPRVLRGDPRRVLRRPARRPLDRACPLGRSRATS